MCSRSLPDGTLRMQVPEELERLRYNGQKLENLTVAADSELKLEFRGDSLELRLTIDPGDTARQCGVKVRTSPGGEEETLIFYDADEKKLKIDTRKSSLTDKVKTVEAGPFELAGGELLRLRIFVDKSIVEVFANDRQAVMRRIYPSREDSLGVALFTRGGSCRVPLLEAWEIMPSNPH